MLDVPLETYVQFRSDRFPPYFDEENEVNPGRFGKRLAEFIQRGLVEKGFPASKPVAEDWGWIVPIRYESFRMWVGCGNHDEFPNDGFLCFIEPHTPVIRKVCRKIDVFEHVCELRDAIDDLLSADSSVRAKKWLTHDDFTHLASHGT